jgi:DNA-3-methyladenine glycosylase
VADREARALPAEGTPSLSRARLARAFFDRPAVEVAPDLLGRVLVRVLPGGARLAGRIVEAEAYEPGDPASHGFRGPTPRNASMFDTPGHLYTYFTYGNHWMANVVTRARGEGSAVLLRALEPLEGLEEMAARRGRADPLDLCSGPGKLAKALGLDRAHDGADLVRGRVVWLEAGEPVEASRIRCGPRVGVSVGGEYDWRFFEADSPWVSTWRGAPRPRASRRRPPRP